MRVFGYISIAIAHASIVYSMSSVSADTPQQISTAYEKQAQGINPGFKGDASRGEDLFRLERKHSKGKVVSCTTCHTQDPKAIGKTRARKKIKPLAPVANSERFTDPKKVEKWFRRNCKDVLERECTLMEKVDFIAFLMTVR